MKELRLLKNYRKKGALRILFSRTGIIALLFVAAMVVTSLLVKFAADMAWTVLALYTIIEFVVIVVIVNGNHDSSSKVTWLLVIAVTSIYGVLFYLFTRLNVGARTIMHEFADEIATHRHDLSQDPQVTQALEKDSNQTADLVKYLNRSGTFPAFAGNDVTYYPSGEECWPDLLADLEKAQEFIFIETFIISEGLMWGSVLDILKRKVEQGVEVRVLYDGTCAIALLPYTYTRNLEAIGIKSKMFAPLRPFVSTHYNYRDHRKITVIDGKVGYTGGINLADEYINHIERFGYWKDTAIRVEGSAVTSLTHMFLSTWNSEDEKDDLDYKPYLQASTAVFPQAKGYVIPYADNPFDGDKVGEKVYLDILNRADTYVHVMTPYLILDDTMLNALKYAAERGVDVKLILPGIPDKKAVYSLAKTYLQTLLDSGVRVYYFTPGFVHAKVFVSDDLKAVVGTINLDYRSLYHHFENAVYMLGTHCVQDIEADFQATLSQCQEVTPEVLRAEKLSEVVRGKTLRLIAPLL